MIKAFSVRWLESDDTKIKYTDEFNSCGYVLKLDILQDAICMLQDEYNAIMEAEEIKWSLKRGENKNVAI